MAVVNHTKQQYMTIQNLQECEQVFNQYMLDAKGIDLTRDVPRVRRILLSIMTDVVQGKPSIGIPASEISAMPLNDLNNLTLNIARDVIVQQEQQKHRGRSGSSGSSHPAPLQPTTSFDIISREMKQPHQHQQTTMMMVPRPVISSNLRAEDGPHMQRTLEHILSEREAPSTSVDMELPKALSASKDDPLDADSFAKRLADMETLRLSSSLPAEESCNSQDVIKPNISKENSVYCPDSLAIYKAGMDDLQAFKNQEHQRTLQELPLGPTALIAPPPMSSASRVQRYLTLAGFDRNWVADPHRYTYTISLQDFVKNIVSLSTTCVIIPMDAARMAPSATVAGSILHSTECTFSHPYLLLNVEDMAVCEGTNDAVRRSFTVLKFDTSYRSSNGRGYIVLVPVQGETKTFQPTPLASLNTLRISLRRPNGMLLSNARDDYTIEKIEYEAFNRIYLKIVTDKYFDRNEFYQGDSIYIRNFLPLPSGPVSDTTQSSTLNAFVSFMNRPEGHDIVEIGQANDNSFYRTFYILAPGTLDQDAGRVEVDTDITALVQAMNADYPASTFQGAIINTSLQVVISMSASSAMGNMPILQHQ